MLRHPSHHLAPGHLHIDALFHQLLPQQLPEGAGDPGILPGQPGLDGPAVLPGGQVQNHPVPLLCQGAAEAVPPEVVQVPPGAKADLGLHLQPVGHHSIQGAQDPVEPGEDAQVFLDIGKIGFLKNLGRHVLILDAPVSQDGRGIRPAEIHGPVRLVGRLGQGITAGEELFHFPIGEAPEMRRQLPGPFLIDGPSRWSQEIPLLPHLLGRGNDDPHRGPPPFRPAARWGRAGIITHHHNRFFLPVQRPSGITISPAQGERGMALFLPHIDPRGR